MIFPFFASFIVFCLFVTFTVKKQTADHEKKEADFWEAEQKANLARRKPLDNLHFIHIPFEKLPVPEISSENSDDFSKAYDTLKTLDEAGIVDLSSKSNTELKMEYGVANLDTLIQYDQNFSDTLIGLDLIAHILYQDGFPSEACEYLEYAVSLRSDISTTYELLVSIYRSQHMERKIENLLPLVSELKSLQKDKIIRTCQVQPAESSIDSPLS